MSNVNLGQVIDRIISRIKKDEEQPTEKTIPETPATQALEQASALTPSPPKTVFVKTSTLNSLEELDKIKDELETGNIIILRLTPMFDRDIDDINRAVRKLKKVATEINGDIASLGEDRIIVTPTRVKIWREKGSKHKTMSKKPTEAE